MLGRWGRHCSQVQAQQPLIYVAHNSLLRQKRSGCPPTLPKNQGPLPERANAAAGRALCQLHSARPPKTQRRVAGGVRVRYCWGAACPSATRRCAAVPAGSHCVAQLANMGAASVENTPLALTTSRQMMLQRITLVLVLLATMHDQLVAGKRELAATR